MYGLNEVGLRRNGFPRETILKLKRAFKIAFRSGLKIEDAIAKIRNEMADIPQAIKFADFLASSRRGTARVSLAKHAFRAV